MHLLRENRDILWVEGFPEPQIPAETQPEEVQPEVPEGEAGEDIHPEDVDAAADPPQTH
ncbi:unnamed protein product, partial [Linum tenue]